MLFSEIYSTYYKVVAEILNMAIKGELNDKTLMEIVETKAFNESVLTIPSSLKSEKWQLITKEFKTPIKKEPTMPLSSLEKRWLKAVSMDKRIRLFDIDFSELKDVEPLFTYDMINYYDRYLDGDDFEDDGYIERFKLIVNAIKQKQPLKIEIALNNSNKTTVNVIPKCLEYSEKDDKFRLITKGDKHRKVINLSTIVSCKPYLGGRFNDLNETEIKKEKITFTVLDERNSMERVMLHFAHFEKQVEKIDDKNYVVNLVYDFQDEIEILIRILSFGQFIKVTKPQSFVDKIKERLEMQKRFKL